MDGMLPIMGNTRLNLPTKLKNKQQCLFGPTIDILKVLCSKVRWPPKIKHFLWQLVSECISVKKMCKREDYKGIYVVLDVEFQRNQ